MIKDFKKPDLKAPRRREGSHNILQHNEFYKDFKLKYPEFELVPDKELKKIIKIFNESLWNHALHNRDGVELPEHLGYIFIGTCSSPKVYNTDFGKSIKNNDIRYRLKNFESDNYLAKIFYTNFSTKYKFKNRMLWKFTAVRDFKRSVSKVYPDNWKKYVQVENGKNISKYLNSYYKEQWIEKQINDFVIDPLYNEFDLN